MSLDLPEGTAVETISVGLRASRTGVVDIDYDGLGEVMVRWDGKKKPVPVDRRTIRRATRPAPPAPPPLERVPETSAQLRAVPRPSPPARCDAYLDFVRAHACAACGALTGIEAHHWSSGRGVGQKVSDFLTVPLCAAQHREFHDTGAIAPRDARQTRGFFVRVQRDLLREWAEIAHRRAS